MSSSQEPPGMPGPDPEARPAPDPSGAEVPDGIPARPRRRRGRTTLIVAGAAVLGVLAGTVTGYAVQYQRQPTPSAPLAQRDLPESKTAPADNRTTARSISANRWSEKTDGDLRRLLVSAPDGAKIEERPDWQDLLLTAADYEHPDAAFSHLLSTGFRRSATTSWSQDGRVYVTVILTQFRDDTAVNSKEFARKQQDFMAEDDHAGNYGKPIPGSVDGRTYVYDKPQTKPGYEPLYEGRAFAWRDGTFMEVLYENNSGPISESALQALAKQQLERL
ncbi:hypothetical protein N4G70_20195 [Streptomyces sp. ASQP_92]|uniref:hypothetical protein n=1 Tax=Streptomyces sp. ASQP_92 TaxID=2979116 RepID=UPI0021BE90B7|nr:hypothetical protein [Streptomyces sp. ASQP_92]MCT9091164.1 hypothetical protein [Streptomyces sp. ASQP_92]